MCIRPHSTFYEAIASSTIATPSQTLYFQEEKEYLPLLMIETEIFVRDRVTTRSHSMRPGHRIPPTRNLRGSGFSVLIDCLNA